MNIFYRELKAHRKSLIIWCIALLFLIVSGMGKFAAYSGSGQTLNEIVGKMPRSVQVVLGLGTFDLSTVSGYYAVLYFYMLIVAGIHAAMLGANIISKEERDKTTEFLFVKPVSRQRVISAKLGAAGVNILIYNLASLLFSLLVVGKYAKGDAYAGDIVKLMLGMLCVQLIFMFVGTSIASFSKNPRIAVSWSSGILLVTFILYEAISLNSNLWILKYLTPFKYFDAENILSSKGIGIVYPILSAVIIAVLFYITYKSFQKRDLKV